MKTFIYQPMVTTAACLLVIAMSNIAEAKPGFGGGGACAGCHNGSTSGALDVLPSDLLQILAGGSQTVTFEFTDIPSGEAALALTGYDDPLLSASFDTGWEVVNGLLAPKEPFVSAPAPKSYTLELTIGAGATLGDYPISGQIGGGPPFVSAGWANTFDFTVRVIPEPATLALMGFGLVGIAVMARHDRRQKSRRRKEHWLKE